MRKTQPILKKGDILSPLRGRMRSNDRYIVNLKKVKIVKIDKLPWWTTKKPHVKFITIEILEGGHGSQKAPESTQIQVFSDAFKVINDEIEYEIW